MKVVLPRLMRSFLFPASDSSRILDWSSSVSLPPRSIPLGARTVTSPTVRTSRLIGFLPLRGSSPPSGRALLLDRPALARSLTFGCFGGLRRPALRGLGGLRPLRGLRRLVFSDVVQALRRFLVVRIVLEDLVEFRLRLRDIPAVRVGLGEPDVTLDVLRLLLRRLLEVRNGVGPVLLEQENHARPALGFRVPGLLGDRRLIGLQSLRERVERGQRLRDPDPGTVVLGIHLERAAQIRDSDVRLLHRQLRETDVHERGYE